MDMGNKPARIYRVPKHRAYTRKEYMGGVPPSKITIFDMGELQDIKQFPVELSLVAKEGGQITHNALEAARIAANRYLLGVLGKTGFYFKVRVYPHNVLRENKQATGAGADRVSEGMRRAFGKAVGLGAVIQGGQKLMNVRVKPEHYAIGKAALRRANSKIPMPCWISLDEGKELLRL